MPDDNCFHEMGELSAQVEALMKARIDMDNRIRMLENDRIRIATIGGIIGLGLTGLGVFFADPIKAFIQKLHY